MSCRPGAAAGWRGQAITHSAGGQRNRLSAGRPGEVLWQLTGSDVISLAINVVQNGFDYQELGPDLTFLVGGSATKQALLLVSLGEPTAFPPAVNGRIRTVNGRRLPSPKRIQYEAGDVDAFESTGVSDALANSTTVSVRLGERLALTLTE